MAVGDSFASSGPTEASTDATLAQVAEKQQRIAAVAAQKLAEDQRAAAERYLYVANMNLAQEAWAQKDNGRLQHLLDETIAYPEKRFEWYYWQRQAHRAEKTLRGHQFTDSNGNYELWTIAPGQFETLRTRLLHFFVGGENQGFESPVYRTETYFTDPFDNDVNADGALDKAYIGGVLSDEDAIGIEGDFLVPGALSGVGAEFSDLASNILTLNNDPLVDGYFDTTLNIAMPQVFQTPDRVDLIVLHAGDADQNEDFDQMDLVQVQVAAKYLTGQPATWGEGDWDGAPGGSPGNPPAGDGQFNQLDIVAAQQGAAYLTGPYGAIQTSGTSGDGQPSVVYNASSGEVSVDAPAGVELTSINVDSAAGIFTGQAAENLDGSFDNDANNNIFKATFGSSFGSVSLGNVAQAGLTEEFLLGDLTVIGSLASGGDLGNVDLIYVPEPTSVLLLSVGLAIGLLHFRRVNR